MLLRKLKKFSSKPWKILRPLGARGFFNWLPNETYIKLVYRCEIGEKLNLKTPKNFNEKLQWLKLFDKHPEYSNYVDKYEVRKHVKKTIGEKYLIPLIAVYDQPSQIMWDELPNKFVLKCTHGSHCHIICTDKKMLDINKEKKRLNKWLKMNWFWFGREYPYKKVKPRIVCEEFISELNDIPNDYKIMCFNGLPKVIQVHKKGNNSAHTIDFYDLKGNLLPIKKSGFNNSGNKKIEICEYTEMLGLARGLAENKKYLRVDFYNIKGKIYFGEMTFFDSSGFIDFEPKNANMYLGNLLALD